MLVEEVLGLLSAVVLLLVVLVHRFVGLRQGHVQEEER